MDPYRLPRTVTPTRYDLRVAPDLEAATFAGTESVRLDVHETVTEIVLNVVDLEIDAASLTAPDGRRLDATVSFESATERAVLELESPAAPGSWVLECSFRGVLNDQLRGFYRSTYTGPSGEQRVIAATQLEATDARRAFPCWDEPDLKAVFGITLVVPDDLTVVSNGPVASTEPAGPGRRAVRFADTMVMSAYLVAFVVGDLEATEPVDVDGVPLRVLHIPGKGHLAEFALEIGAFCLRWFSDYYRVPIPSRSST